MSDPFRQYFLESIQTTLQQKANQESLLALFRFVTPSLTLDQVLTMPPRERHKIFKILKTRIHPDKHPHDPSVTQLFQNVQIFYDECLAFLAAGGALSTTSHGTRTSSSSSDGDGDSNRDFVQGSSRSTKRRRKPSHSTQVMASKKYPPNFSCYDQWPHIQTSVNTADVDSEVKLVVPSHPIPPNGKWIKDMVPVYQAYKCIHARGAIAHGRPISMYKTYEDIIHASEKKKCVHDIFDEFGGTKEMDSVVAIKEELLNRGPVVSISFRLLDVYLEQLQVGSTAFAQDLIGETHELLIVGWCLTPYGEAWLVQPLLDKDVTPHLIRIGFGQFGIDDLVLAPESSLEHVPWQTGPYFDYDFSDVENWREWKEMDLPIGEKDLKKLAMCMLPGGLMSGQSFVLRDEVKKAHSGSYKIKNIRWEEDTTEWFVQVYQCDDENEL